MVADYGHDARESNEAASNAQHAAHETHKTNSPQQPHFHKIESPTPGAAARNDSPAPRGSQHRGPRDEGNGTTRSSRRGSMPSQQHSSTKQQERTQDVVTSPRFAAYSLDELSKLQTQEHELRKRLLAAERKVLGSETHASNGEVDKDAGGLDAREQGHQAQEGDDENDEGTSDDELLDAEQEADAEREARVERAMMAEAEYRRALAALDSHAGQSKNKGELKDTKPRVDERPTSSGAKATYLKQLNDAEVKKWSFEPTPSAIATDYVDALNYLTDKTPQLEEWRALLHMTEQQAAAKLKEDTTLRELDGYMRNSLAQLVAKGSDEGKLSKLFASEERKMPRHAWTRTGVALAGRIATFGAAATLTEAKARYEDGIKKAKGGIKAGASATKIKLVLDHIRDLHASLRKRLKETIDEHQTMIDAIPDNVAEDSTRSYKERLQDEMDEHLEIHGEHKYTTVILRNVIAKRVSKTNPPPSAFVATRKAPPAKGETDASTKGGDARAKLYDGKTLEGEVGRIHTSAFGGSKFTFVVFDDGKGGTEDIFCHLNDVVGGELKEGDRVQFTISYSPRNNKDKATKVTRLSATAAVASGDDEETEYDASTMW